MTPERPERMAALIGRGWAPYAAWSLTAAIFALDLITRPENMSVCFAYLAPVFITSCERSPRPFLHAGAATALTLAAAVPLPPEGLPATSVAMDRSIAIAMVWLGAVLVREQARRRLHLQLDVERQQRFVDILSHEIRNALTAVGGHAQRLARLSDRLGPAEVASRADKIRTAAARIEAIIARVQFASALGNGMTPMSREEIDLNALVRQLVDRLKEEHDGQPIELRLAPTPLRTVGDDVLLRHAIENILRNSLLYAPGGGPIVVQTDDAGPVARVVISDRGPGVSPDDLKRIREPYFRGTGSKGTSGTGLGLYFADRIVQGHQGSLDIESRPGVGTRVIIELPDIERGTRR